MADFDCDYCAKSTMLCGKCDRYEYNCPFAAFETYDENKIKTLSQQIKVISEAVNLLKEMDNEEIFEDAISSINETLEEIKECLSDETKKEWQYIRD